MSILKRILTLCLTAAAMLSSGCRNEKPAPQGTVIKADKKVELVTQHEGEQRPYFRATLKFKNPDGSDADVKLPNAPDDAFKKSFKITTTPKKTGQPPFYVVTGTQTISSGTARSEVIHDILLLFDVSGSMKKGDIQPTRFGMAQQAAAGLVNSLPANYRVAIAPFESINVKSTIEKAEFFPPKEAGNEIGKLPKPDRGNTALYSAIETALVVLKKRKSENFSQDQSLIVLTDGRNDVQPPSDSNLLDGEGGFQKVLGEAKRSDIRIFTIGLGQPRQEGKDDLAFDEDKLKALAFSDTENRYFKTDNLNDLRTKFAEVQQAVSRTVKITFCTNDKNLKDLRSLNFDISYTAPSIGTIRGIIPWVCDSIAGCVASGILTPQEMNELGKSGCEGGAAEVWKQILWLFGQLALFSGGIAVLWMFLPSLIWPSVPLPQLPSRGKQKAEPPAKPSSRVSPSSSSGPPDRATPAKPRQRFEETRFHDSPGGRDTPRGK